MWSWPGVTRLTLALFNITPGQGQGPALVTIPASDWSVWADSGLWLVETGVRMTPGEHQAVMYYQFYTESSHIPLTSRIIIIIQANPINVHLKPIITLIQCEVIMRRCIIVQIRPTQTDTSSTFQYPLSSVHPCCCPLMLSVIHVSVAVCEPRSVTNQSEANSVPSVCWHLPGAPLRLFNPSMCPMPDPDTAIVCRSPANTMFVNKPYIVSLYHIYDRADMMNQDLDT